MKIWKLVPALGFMAITVVQAQSFPAQVPLPMKSGTIGAAPVLSGPEVQFAKPANPGEVVAPRMGSVPQVFGQSPIQLPSPAQPLAGVTLPNQGRGDGAYNGGGAVLEQDSSGVTRQIR